MRIFKCIREFFWPLLDKEIPKKQIEITIEDITVGETQMEKALEYAIHCFNAEEERRKTVEGKSSIFIGTISVATSVLIGITSTLIKIEECNSAIVILVSLLFILTIYMTRTVWFSIKVLEREKYHTISIDDFLKTENGNIFNRRIISDIVNYTRNNSWVINRKVDNMTMAQAYFKRAIVTISLCSIILVFIFFTKQNAYIQILFQQFVDILNQINVNSWNLIILYTLTISSIAMSIIALRRRNK